MICVAFPYPPLNSKSKYLMANQGGVQVNRYLVTIILLIALDGRSLGVEASIHVERCSSPHPSFQQTAPNSKYLYNTGMNTIPLSYFGHRCQEIGLEAAEIRSQEDLAHLEKFFTKSRFFGQTWGLGMNDGERAGVFLEADSLTPIRYQVFETDPAFGVHCVALRRKQFSKEMRWVMTSKDCAGPVNILCQFPRMSKCFLNSPQSLSVKRDEMSFVGSSTARLYFVGARQGLWGEANAKCESSQSHLVDLEVDGREAEVLSQMLRSWLETQELHMDTPFWTSGQMSDDSPEYFSWKTTGHDFDMANSSVEWTWDKNEPSDGGSGLEKCISFRIPDFFQNGINPYAFRLSNCQLPNYFVCYKDISFKANEIYEEPDLELDQSEKTESEGVSETKQPCFISEMPTIELNKPGLSTEDAMTLAMLNSKNDLQRGNMEFQLPSGMDWKRDFVNILSDITKSKCPNDAVPHGFVNVMKSFILIYMQNIKSETVKITDRKLWDKMTFELSECMGKIKAPLNISSSGNMHHTFGGMPMIVIAEEVDDRSKYPPLDIVIDTFWFMFELSMGTCYPLFKSKTNWFVNYYFNFKSEFMEDMVTRWVLASYKEGINFGSIIGDFDISTAIYNLRICSTATHIKNNIQDRMMSRPIFLSVDGHEIPNEKTSEPLEIGPYFY